MKINKRYFVLSLVAVMAVAGLSFGSASFAQATPLMCTANPSSVGINQQTTLTATGGNGTYSWSAIGLASNPTGNILGISINVPGTHVMTVVSGSDSATCLVFVTATEFPAPGTAAPSFPSTGGGYGQ